MITVIMFIGAIAFFVSIMFAPNMRTRWILGLITGLIFVGSTVIITANFHDHWGMKRITTTKTQKIYSASSQMQLILYQPVGTSGKDNVYIYQTKPRQKTPQHTQANEFTTNRLVWTDSDQATLTVKETRWRFKNDFYKVLFAGSKMDGKLVSRTNTFRYPKTFVKISVKQAQALKKQAQALKSPATQAQLKAQAAAYVTAKVQAAKQQNPDLTEAQLQKLTEQAQQEYQAQMIKKMMAAK
ncbi:DUF4811 domain-containing protein [Limosilactobacillus mucosae]|uniref:DUF4811 domain-containing protein n=2 Tax=Limosilactobacillus mucosae TaxID=97478 RepID=A0A0R1P2L1_LIMMU|nr:DUF4811 domain-containing protein [Limosilactobacillus mucosae]KRL26807.1 hypothetical protein FC47_GL000943 [Limosilactobacillus mucosae DSM 13345]QOL70044.1 DUF4811 domain-containing protein [Limosilactobacillus mucosae]UNL62306.1 DUF4811 domain-containing protein [Limosilactobacillus mucosae]